MGPNEDKDFDATYIPDPPSNDFEYNVWKAQYVEPTIVLFGNDSRGDCTQVVVRGYRPFIRLLLPEQENLTLEMSKEKLLTFLTCAFTGVGKIKAALLDHVLFDEMIIEELLDFYMFNGNKKKRFLRVSFHSFAAYHHFRSVFQNLELLQKYKVTTSEAFNRIERELVKEKKLIEQHFANTKRKSKAKTGSGVVLFSKAEKEEKQSHIQKLELVSKAYHATHYLEGRSLEWPIYDSALDPVLDFLHINDIQTQWIEVPQIPYQPTSPHEINLFRSAKLQSIVNINQIKVRNDIETTAPFLQCSLDIETYSDQFHDPITKKNRKFPEAKFPGNICFQIALTPLRYGEDLSAMSKVLLTLGNPDILSEESLDPTDPNYIKVYRIETEGALLKKLFELIYEWGVDFFFTYNGNNFDMHYIYQRAAYRGLVLEKPIWSWNSPKEETKTLYHKAVQDGVMNTLLSRSGKTNIQQKNSIFQTGAFGTAEYRKVLIPGRLHLDLLPYMRANHKLETHKLDFVAQHFLKEGKDDMKPEELHLSFQKQDKPELARAGRYCVQDTSLLQRLVSHPKLKIIENLVEMSRVCLVPIEYIISRGQQIKVFSQLSSMARSLKRAVPHVIEDSQFCDNRLVGRLDANGDLLDIDEDDDEELEEELTIDEDEIHPEIQTSKHCDNSSGLKRKQPDSQQQTLTSFFTSSSNDGQTKRLKPEINSTLDSFVTQMEPPKIQPPAKKRLPVPKPLKQYEGATVIKPKVGAYLKNPIVTLDFASLYPGIIQYYNIDYFTIIKDRDEIEKLLAEGFKIDIHEWKDRVNGVEFYVGIAKEDPQGNPIVGALPEMLRRLYQKRKAIKREMKKLPEDSPRYAMLDAKQLAVKISMNSGKKITNTLT